MRAILQFEDEGDFLTSEKCVAQARKFSRGVFLEKFAALLAARPTD